MSKVETGILVNIDWKSLDVFLAYCHKNVLGPASGLSNVGSGCLGRGPFALYGQKSGLAFAKNKGPSNEESGSREAISNEEMGQLLVRAEMIKHPEETVEGITKRLFQQEERKTREVALAKLRESSQTAIAAILARIAPDALLNLGNDKEFEDASRGSCLVTLVDQMLRLAANCNRNLKTDQREAERELERVIMTEEAGFYRFKYSFEQALNRCDYVKCKLKREEIIEQAVANLSDRVFPNVKRDLHKKTGEYGNLTNLESLWTVLEKEYNLYLKFLPASNASSTVQVHSGSVSKTDEVEHVAYVATMSQDQFDAAVTQKVEEQLKKRTNGGGGGRANEDTRDYKRSRPNNFCHSFARFGTCKFKEDCSFEYCNDRAVLAKAGYEAPPEEFFNRNRNRPNNNTPRGNSNNSSGGNNISTNNGATERMEAMLSAMSENLQKVAEVIKAAPAAGSTGMPTSKKSNLKELHPSAINPSVNFTNESTTQAAFIGAMEAAAKHAQAYKMDLASEK